MVCLKYHPIKGTGYGNAKDSIKESMKNLNIPLTEELTLVNFVFDSANAPPCIFFSIICQTGIIGIILLYSFILKTIFQINKIKKYFVGYDRLLIDITLLTSINYVVISFYWSFDSYPMMWFLLGFLIFYIFMYKLNKNKIEEISQQNKYKLITRKD